MSTLIIAHGDLDGITSAALLADRLGIEPGDLNVIFTQPFLVDKIAISDEVEKVYVVDIAINNRDQEMTYKFISDLGSKLVRWYDHHAGWKKGTEPHDFEMACGLTTAYGGKIIAQTGRACAVLLGHRSDIRVQDAIAADTRQGELSTTGQLIERAVKSDMSNDQIRMWGVKLLIGAEEYRAPLKAAERAYQLVENETDRLSQLYVFKGKVAFVDATNSNHAYDLTQLLLKGQELATFAVAKTVNPKTEEEKVTVATKSGVNLVELFGLGSGAPFRVSLPANQLPKILKKLEVV